MPDVLIRDIDEETLKNLKKNAAYRNRSLQADLKSILEEHGRRSLEDSKKEILAFRDKLRKEGRFFSDSTEIIREMRDSR